MPSAYCPKCAKERSFDRKTLRCLACNKVIWECVARQCMSSSESEVLRTTSKTYSQLQRFCDRR